MSLHYYFCHFYLEKSYPPSWGEVLSPPLHFLCTNYLFFYWQVGATSKKVLAQSPGALNTLRENEDKINELKPTAFERAVARGMTQRRARAAVINIDANCTRIGEALAAAMETMTAVDNDYKRIKAAMLW